MVDEVLFNADIPLEHVLEELLVELGMFVEHLEHVFPFNHDDRACIQRHGGGDVRVLTGQTPFSEEVARLQHADDRLLSPRREHGQLHRPLL